MLSAGKQVFLNVWGKNSDGYVVSSTFKKHPGLETANTPVWSCLRAAAAAEGRAWPLVGPPSQHPFDPQGAVRWGSPTTGRSLRDNWADRVHCWPRAATSTVPPARCCPSPAAPDQSSEDRVSSGQSNPTETFWRRKHKHSRHYVNKPASGLKSLLT